MRRKPTDAGSPVSFDTQVEGDLLRIVVRGKLEADFAERMLQEIQRLVRHSPIRRLIGDMRLATPVIDPLHVNRQIARICEDEILSSTRMAVIVSVRSSNFVYLEEVAAQNALEMRMFTDGALAEDWLNEPDIGQAKAS